MAMTRSPRRRAGERGRDALPLVARRHLGMDEGDPLPLDHVLQDTRHFAADRGLVAAALRAVGDDKIHGGRRRSVRHEAGTSSLAAAADPVASLHATTPAPTCQMDGIAT